MSSILENTTKRERTSIVKGLDRTIEAIRDVGWCKGQSYKTDSEGNEIAFCVSGAAGHVNAPAKTIDILGEYLKTSGKRRDGCAISYNDSRNTTKRNMLDALRGAKRMVENFTKSA